MNLTHREATELLSDWETGSLAPEIAAQLSAHAESCTACREWLDTHELVARKLHRQGIQEASHSESDLLALCVVRPEEIDEPDRQEVRAHLEHCSSCREAVSLMRGALRQARPSSLEPARAYPVESASMRWTGMLAAGLAAAVIGGALLFAPAALDRSSSEDESVAQGRPIPNSPVLSGAAEVLSGRDLEGITVIHANRSLTVANVAVKSGADVTLRASELIAFGDGFQVASGARLTVMSDRTRPPDS